MIKELLDKSTISFTNNTNTYVNAFGVWNGVEDKLACTVKPSESLYTYPTESTPSEYEEANLFIYNKK